MSASEACVRVGFPPQSEPTVAIDHLRRVIETQPSCLLRAGVDGLLLAANDAALSLLGAHELGQVLGTAFTTWIVPEHRDRWAEFAGRVEGEAASSLECDVTDLFGTRRTIFFHGVPLLDHLDGIPSVMLGARDTSALHEPERACVDEAQRVPAEPNQTEQLLKEGRTHLEEQRAQLAASAAERRRLEMLLEQREAAFQQLLIEHAQLKNVQTDHREGGCTIERRVAPRLPKALVPSITGIRLSPYGGDTSLINISATGAVLKGDTRPGIGTPVTVNVEGTFAPSSIRGRVARCLVAAIQSGVVWYHIGIVFDSPIPVDAATETPDAPSPQPLSIPQSSASPAIVFNRW